MTERQQLPPQDRQAFARLLDAYGAYSHHWPEDRRAWAEALVAASEEARRMRQEVLVLDNLLDLAPAEPAADALMERVLQTAPEASLRKTKGGFSLKAFWPFDSIWQPLSAVTVAGIFGLMLGATTPDLLYGSQEISEFEQVQYMVSDVALPSSLLEGEIN